MTLSLAKGRSTHLDSENLRRCFSLAAHAEVSLAVFPVEHHNIIASGRNASSLRATMMGAALSERFCGNTITPVDYGSFGVGKPFREALLKRT
jgi:hypothetical protein